MYIKKSDKIQIIKWYIKNHINTPQDLDIDHINDLKELEKIVRTNENVFQKVNGCQCCHYEGLSFCKQCSNCKEWHWDRDIAEETDNYVFRYGYWRNFYQ